MNIAQMNLQRDYGGAEKHVQTLALGLQARGHAVRVFCHPQGRLRQECERQNGRVEPLRARGQFAPVAALRLAARLRRERPDILHLHTPKDYLCGLVAGRLARVGGIVLTRHMLLPLKPLMRRVYGRMDAIVCLSQGLRDLLQTQGVPADKLALIYGAINTSPFDPPADLENILRLRREWQTERDEILIGCVGRLVAGKGQEILLDAFAQCSLENKNENTEDLRMTLVLIGDGPERAGLEAHAARIGIATNVRFAGFRDDIPRVLQALDIVAVPSTGAELLPLTVMEAMAAARPVVAAKIGGVPEIIVREHLGLLVPPGDVSALAGALRRLSSEPVLRRVLGVAGSDWVRSQFALPRLLDDTERLYARMLRQADAQGAGA